MARFNTIPPTDPLPRSMPEMPSQAQLPDVLEGLPTVPVVETTEHFPDDEVPGEALDHLPW